ncbi:MerR family transcriptional regulator [Flavobacteriales bacterium]|nr:MerR family transcriptional regulator [Flavobacteriales bacterium]
MSIYSIKELEKLSGIKAHTIRIWEKRYALLTPLRTETNIRYYGDNELVKLLNVTSLISLGFKISKISKMSNDEINQQLDNLIDDIKFSDSISEVLTNQLIASALHYDEHAFQKAFSLAILRYGLIDTYIKVIYPLLEKVGILWKKSDLMPAQEHFLSNLIKQKIQSAIDNVAPASPSDQPWVLFLLEEEVHDIGLLLSSYIIREHGRPVIYLGARVPTDSLYSVLELFPKAKLLFFLVKEFDGKDISSLVKNINANYPNSTIHISTNPKRVEKMEVDIDFEKINSVEDLLKKI